MLIDLDVIRARMLEIIFSFIFLFISLLSIEAQSKFENGDIIYDGDVLKIDCDEGNGFSIDAEGLGLNEQLSKLNNLLYGNLPAAFDSQFYTGRDDKFFKIRILNCEDTLNAYSKLEQHLLKYFEFEKKDTVLHFFDYELELKDSSLLLLSIEQGIEPSFSTYHYGLDSLRFKTWNMTLSGLSSLIALNLGPYHKLVKYPLDSFQYNFDLFHEDYYSYNSYKKALLIYGLELHLVKSFSSKAYYFITKKSHQKKVEWSYIPNILIIR